MELKTYSDSLPESEKKTVLSIEPNTLLIFKSFHFKDYVYSVYSACLLLRNAIDENTILETLPLFEKSNNLEKIQKNIKKALQKLLDKKYLVRHRNKTYSIVSQGKANRSNLEKFRIPFLNFYDSCFKVAKWQIAYYQSQSNDPSFMAFLFGELVARTYFEVPTTYETIKKDLLLSRYDLSKIYDLKSKEHHLNHYNPKDTSFYNINQNFACIGKKYYKDFFATELKLTKHLKDKLTLIDQNLIDRWGDVMNHSQKISFTKEVMGFSNNGSLSVREITIRYPSFFSERKRDWFLPCLSEKLITNGFKQNTKMRKDIIRQDKDMLWWKDPQDLIDYTHPYKFDAPLQSHFHLYK